VGFPPLLTINIMYKYLIISLLFFPSTSHATFYGSDDGMSNGTLADSIAGVCGAEWGANWTGTHLFGGATTYTYSFKCYHYIPPSPSYYDNGDWHTVSKYCSSSDGSAVLDTGSCSDDPCTATDNQGTSFNTSEGATAPEQICSAPDSSGDISELPTGTGCYYEPNGSSTTMGGTTSWGYDDTGQQCDMTPVVPPPDPEPTTTTTTTTTTDPVTSDVTTTTVETTTFGDGSTSSTTTVQIIDGTTGDTTTTSTGSAATEGSASSCGGTGQPACSISLDTTGMPGDLGATAYDGIMTATGINEYIDGVATVDISIAPNVMDFGISAYFPDAGTCSDYSFSFAGQSIVIPLATSPKMGLLRDILSWLIYMFTAYYLFGLVTQKVEK
jgi:hypothetical protein